MTRPYAKRKMIHGHSQRGAMSPEYRVWASMINRCNNPKNKRFADYGGRGIQVCDAWRNDFRIFLADMGSRPSPQHTINRIDNSLGYFPVNCHWATSQEQMSNRRNNVIPGTTLKKECEKRGVNFSTASYRLRVLKWPLEKALEARDGRRR